MRFNSHWYRALPPCPHDIRVFGDPSATDGFHLLYDGTVGVTLSDEPQLLEVNLVRSNGSPALAGHYLVDVLPRPRILSMLSLIHI